MQTSANAASPFGSMAHNQHFYPSPSNPSPQISSKPLPGSSGVSMPNGIAHSPANHTSSPFFNNASPNGKASPMRGPSSPPKSSSEQPDTSQTTSHSSKRKKQRIEYVPWSKPAAESIGGFSLAVREQQVTQVQQRVRQRTVHDLGNVDFLSLKLSLQSGLPSEVTPVLNSLSIMAGACRAPTHEEGIVFNQAQMEDVSALYEALINYLADSAFPVTTPCQGSPPREKGKGKEPPERPFAPSTYDEMLQLAMQRESAIKPARKRRQNGSPPAPETILSIVNTLRSFALSFNLGPYIARSQRTLDLLLRLCDFPLLSGGAVLDTNRRPLRSAIELSWLDLLTIRKDMLVIIAQLGLQIEVDKLPRRTTKQLFDLICFFLSQPSDIDLPASYGGSHSGRSAIRRGSYGTYTEAALTALSQVATRDSNRETFGSLASPTQVFNLFDALFQCLPLTDDDFSGLLEHPIESIHRLERLALCLYNIAFLAPTEVKNRIRQRPGFGRVIYGVMNKISSANNVSQSPTRELGVFCRRLLEMMDILSKSPDAADSYYDPLAPFFGGAFAGGLSGERRERESQSERRLQGEVVEAPRAEDLPSITCYSAGIIEMLASPGHDPVVYNLLAKLL